MLHKKSRHAGVPSVQVVVVQKCEVVAGAEHDNEKDGEAAAPHALRRVGPGRCRHVSCECAGSGLSEDDGSRAWVRSATSGCRFHGGTPRCETPDRGVVDGVVVHDDDMTEGGGPMRPPDGGARGRGCVLGPKHDRPLRGLRQMAT